MSVLFHLWPCRYIVLDNGLQALLISDYSGPLLSDDEESEGGDEEEEEEENPESEDESGDEDDEDDEDEGSDVDEKGKKKKGNAEKQVLHCFIAETFML